MSKGWTRTNLGMVDWIGLQNFLKTQSPISRCKILQSMHNWQNTGYQKSQFQRSSLEQTCMKGTNSVELCPLGCNNTETPFHYMYCRSDEMSQQRDKELLTIKKELTKLKTAPSLQEAILEGLHCILDQTEYDLHPKSHSALFDEAHSCLLGRQASIGWEYFLKGFITKEWGIIQGQYYKLQSLNNRKYTPNRWVVQVLYLLHSFRKSMWTIRNASIHGGPTPLLGKVLRQRLVRDVRTLYAKNRSHLSLADKEIFKLPLQY